LDGFGWLDVIWTGWLSNFWRQSRRLDVLWIGWLPADEAATIPSIYIKSLEIRGDVIRVALAVARV
jgi:hypothetical protein